MQVQVAFLNFLKQFRFLTAYPLKRANAAPADLSNRSTSDPVDYIFCRQSTDGKDVRIILYDFLQVRVIFFASGVPAMLLCFLLV